MAAEHNIIYSGYIVSLMQLYDKSQWDLHY